MAKLKTIFKDYLKKYNLSASDLSKRQHKTEKEEILKALLRASVVNHSTRKQAFADVRKLIKFSNTTAGKYWDEYNKFNKPKEYSSRLKRQYKPKIQSIGDYKYLVREVNYYVAKTYLWCEDKQKRKRRKIPKSAVNIRGTHYNKISEFGFRSEKILTRNEVDKLFYDYLANGHVSDETIETSDFKGIFSEGTCFIVAFKYNRSFKRG